MYMLEAAGACLGLCRCYMQVIQSGGCGVPSTSARKEIQGPEDSR